MDLMGGWMMPWLIVVRLQVFVRALVEVGGIDVMWQAVV